MQWYYIVGGIQKGPVGEDELSRLAREGFLKPGDHVWNESLGNQWVAAGSVNGLFGPPPMPDQASSAPVPPAIHAAAGGISCAGAIGPAWDRMKLVLFSPFDLGKWFMLGVSAWLATFGEGGGGFNIPNLGKPGGRAVTSAFEQQMHQALNWARLNLSLVIGIGAFVILLSVVFGLVFLWLRCRGKFMLLDNVVHNRTEVAAPWEAFAAQGNSLFKWCLAYGIVVAVILLVLIGVAVWGVVVPCVVKRAFVMATIPVLLAVALAMLAFGVVAAYISRFLEDFIVPVMYRYGVTATEAWRRFMPLLKGDFSTFVLYGLFYLALGLVAGLAVLAFILITCCVAGCLMLIPYVGAVVMLPVTVFFRLYSLEFLAQFGPEWDARQGASGSGL